MNLLGENLATKSQDISAEPLSDEEFRQVVFHPNALAKFRHAEHSNTKFVQYTTAENAMKIFQSNHIWLRNSTCMNDFMEIEYGLGCLESTYKKHEEKINATLGGLFPNLPAKLMYYFAKWIPIIRKQTFIACVSEHGNEHPEQVEDDIGRLSMWRAYGGSSGVAIVMNGGPFLRPTDAVGAFVSPIDYSSEDKFENDFIGMLESITSHKERLMKLGEDWLLESLNYCYLRALLCTKHPGFVEEREWRVIFNPNLQSKSLLISDLQTIAGIPQQIYKLPLKDVPEEKFYGAELPQLINRVIIGPTSFPDVIKAAIVSQLTACGLQNAGDIVKVSNIPLR